MFFAGVARLGGGTRVDGAAVRRSSAWGLALVLWVSAAPAHAFPWRVREIPNAPDRCATCHEEASGGGELNVFGWDVDETSSTGGVRWGLLFALDSDRDGFTNGEELGDPSGAWRIGDPSPPGPSTNPGIATDFPGAPDRGDGGPDAGSAPDAGTADLAADAGPSPELGVGVDVGPDASSPGGADLGVRNPGPGQRLGPSGCSQSSAEPWWLVLALCGGAVIARARRVE